MPSHLIFSINKIKYLLWRFCELILVYFNRLCQVKPGKLTQYRRLLSDSLIDTLKKFSKPSANKITSLFEHSCANSPLLISKTLIIFLFVFFHHHQDICFLIYWRNLLSSNHQKVFSIIRTIKIIKSICYFWI